MIVRNAGKISENLYMIDTGQFNLSRITTVFCCFDGSKAMLMDIGTSNDVDRVLSTLEEYGIPLSCLAGITLSHYHFDHAGGCCVLWNRMKGINPDFRIYTTELTMKLLQDASGHVTGAGTTFGPFVGTMDFIPQEAFCIVEEDAFLPVEFNDGARIQLVHSPGHTPDHCSPSVVRDGRVDFMFAGEACGTFYTEDRILTTPSSMPPNFRYGLYMESMEKIRAKKPEMAGFCHYGIISGREDVDFFFSDHRRFMEDFRALIIEAFEENPSTGHVMERTAHLWENRFGKALLKERGSENFFRNLRLALTYGVMVDLGLREPRYERRMEI